MKSIFRLSLACFVFFNFSYGQDAKPDAYQDSLQRVIDSNIKSDQKKEALFLLGEYVVQRDPELAEETASRLKDNFVNQLDSNEVRRNNYIFAASHRWQGDYQTALDYYRKIYDYSKQHNDSVDIAKSGHFIGTISMFLGNNVVSQNYLLEVANIYNNIGTPKQKARINSTLASFYLNIDQLEKGKEQYLKALQEFEVLNDSSGMASVNANLGYVYTELGNFKEAEKHLMKQKKLNKVFPTLREMGFHHDFLGILRQKEGRLDEAYQEHLKALNIRKNLSSTYNLCESRLNMGEVLIKLKRYPEAVEHLKEVFKYQEHESLNQQLNAYQLLSEAYEKSGQYNKALDNYKLYKTINDSIYSKESIEIIAEKDAQYDKQKKDSEIALLNKEKEISKAQLSRSRIIQLASLIGLVLLLTAAIVFYKMYLKIKSKNRVITKSLKDRELLLHETHHRVKNNLQMISSLLNLQSKYVNDEKALEVLQNGRNRVQSMALLHKNLYAGEDLTMVNLQDYFEGLISSIFNSYHKSDNDIQSEVNAQGVVMDVESVVPIGLIVNELVTNSLKHAFTDKTDGKASMIFIKMIETDENYLLSVVDNGKGINDEVITDSKTNGAFGQRLISSFMQKLKAKIKIKNTNGTEVEIIIPKKN